LNIVQEVLKENSQEKLRSEHIMLILNKLDLTNVNANANTATTTTTLNSNYLNMASTIGLKFGGGTHQISCVTQQGIDGFFLDALTKSVVTRTQGAKIMAERGHSSPQLKTDHMWKP
jgi:hypothetical protein